MAVNRMVLGTLNVSGSGLFTVYTVPSGVVDTVEMISASRYGAGTVYVETGIHRSPQFYELAHASLAGTPGVFEWRGKHVLEPGDSIYLYSPSAGALILWASGFRVS